MNYTTKLYTSKKASVLIPQFFPEEGIAGEIENVRRMNEFYDELKKSVFNYTDSDMFPDKGRYFAKASVSKESDNIRVRVVMRLRLDGKTASSKDMTHVWKDGAVRQKILQ